MTNIKQIIQTQTAGNTSREATTTLVEALNVETKSEALVQLAQEVQNSSIEFANEFAQVLYFMAQAELPRPRKAKDNKEKEERSLIIEEIVSNFLDIAPTEEQEYFSRNDIFEAIETELENAGIKNSKGEKMTAQALQSELTKMEKAGTLTSAPKYKVDKKTVQRKGYKLNFEA